MKKLAIIGSVLIVLLISACEGGNSDSKSKANTISSADLNEREDSILSTISDDSFIFDYHLDTDFDEVTLWVEKYEAGELVDDELNKMSTTIDKSKGTIILATAKTDDEKNEQNYHIGVGEEGGSSSAFVPVKTKKDAEDQMTISGQLADEMTFDDKEENVLAAIAYSDDEYGTNSISNDFYENPEDHMDELDKYSVVYLFKAAFVK